ncbi:MAG TPA: hypothetical protein VIN09_01625 [Chloroflexota bacterium]
MAGEEQRKRRGSSASPVVEAFDVVFVLILCYLSLLLPILLRGAVIVQVK